MTTDPPMVQSYLQPYPEENLKRSYAIIGEKNQHIVKLDAELDKLKEAIRVKDVQIEGAKHLTTMIDAKNETITHLKREQSDEKTIHEKAEASLRTQLNDRNDANARYAKRDNEQIDTMRKQEHLLEVANDELKRLNDREAVMTMNLATMETERDELQSNLKNAVKCRVISEAETQRFRKKIAALKVEICELKRDITAQSTEQTRLSAKVVDLEEDVKTTSEENAVIFKERGDLAEKEVLLSALNEHLFGTIETLRLLLEKGK